MPRRYNAMLDIKTFTVNVWVVPPIASGREPYQEKRVIKGYTLEDAKKRAGIQ